MAIIAIPFILAALLIIGFSLMEIQEEKKFLKTAKKTQGKVVGGVPAIKKGRAAFGNVQNVLPMPNNMPGTQGTKTHKGQFALVEYEVENGDIYEKKSKKVYGDLPSTLEVFYDPNKPGSDVMMDGFYKVEASSLRYRFIAGGMVLLAAIAFLLI